MNDFKSIQSGKAELKDYYPDNSKKESISEALKRRRKKSIEKFGLESDDEIDKTKEEKP